MKSILRFLVFVLVIGLCVTALYFWRLSSVFRTRLGLEKNPPVSLTAAHLPVISGNTSLASLDNEIIHLVNGILPSVVSIESVAGQRPVANPLARLFGVPSDAPEKHLGSGVIVSKEGHIITNLHVVQGGDSVEVILHDGRRYSATLTGSYAPADIAILKIDANDLQPIRIGNSDEVQVGQTVFAIGNPYGLQESVSNGIISAKGRRSPNESSMNEFFQTNATLNPGNSGGPLINTKGELIGVNDFIFSQNGGSQGIGFAIPSNTARKIFDDIVSKGRVISPYLGAGTRWRTIPPRIAVQLKLPDEKGVVVTDVQKSSPAEMAGILPGDVIRELNRRAILDSADLRNRLAEIQPGKTVPVEIIRDGKPLMLEAKIVEQPNEENLFYLPVHPPGERTAMDGIIVYDLAPEMRTHHLSGGTTGVMVSGFQNAAPAARILQPRDIILQIGDQPITSLEVFQNISKGLSPNLPQKLFVQRGDLQGWVQIDPR